MKSKYKRICAIVLLVVFLLSGLFLRICILFQNAAKGTTAITFPNPTFDWMMIIVAVYFIPLLHVIIYFAKSAEMVTFKKILSIMLGLIYFIFGVFLIARITITQ